MLQILYAILYVGDEHKNQEVSEIVGADTKTVSRANGVLYKDFSNVEYKIRKRKTNEGEWRTVGVYLDISAFDFGRREGTFCPSYKEK